MKKNYLLVCFVFLCSSLFAQSDMLGWLNVHAINLTNYQKQLQLDLLNNKVLLLGEATHGTKEFFLEKNNIIKNLVEHANYQLIGFELTDTEIAKVNNFILGKADNLQEAMQGFRAYKTKEFLALFTWLRAHNNKPNVNKVEVFGFHKEEFTNPFERNKLMTEEVIKKQKIANQKVILWAHNIHTARNTTMAEISVMGDYLTKAYENKFFNIVFDTYQGTVSTMNWDEHIKDYVFKVDILPQPSAESFTHQFNLASFDNFYVRLKDTSPFVIERKITNIMVNWRAPFDLPTQLAKDFDALIFIKQTSASEIIN